MILLKLKENRRVMVVEIKYRGNKPERQRKLDAAFDLRAQEFGILAPGTRKLVETGTQVAIPEGYVGLVCSRSGLANKFGVFVLNAPGIVDPDYIGDVGVILENMGKEAFFYEPGDRIAQLLIMETPDVKFTKSQKELKSSVRGDNGFGSSGVA